MGARGPAPTPTPILEARSSWRAGERTGEVQFEAGKPSCPTWLGKEAKAEWRRQVAQLERAGVLQVTDRALLAAYCEAWGEFVEVAQAVAAKCRPEGEGGMGPGGYAAAIAEGLVNAKNRAAERLIRLAQQFGFSPSARTRVRTQEQPPTPTGKARIFTG